MIVISSVKAEGFLHLRLSRSFAHRYDLDVRPMVAKDLPALMRISTGTAAPQPIGYMKWELLQKQPYLGLIMSAPWGISSFGVAAWMQGGGQVPKKSVELLRERKAFASEASLIGFMAGIDLDNLARVPVFDTSYDWLYKYKADMLRVGMSFWKAEQYTMSLDMKERFRPFHMDTWVSETSVTDRDGNTVGDFSREFYRQETEYLDKMYPHNTAAYKSKAWLKFYEQFDFRASINQPTGPEKIGEIYYQALLWSMTDNQYGWRCFPWLHHRFDSPWGLIKSPARSRSIGNAGVSGMGTSTFAIRHVSSKYIDILEQDKAIDWSRTDIRRNRMGITSYTPEEIESGDSEEKSLMIRWRRGIDSPSLEISDNMRRTYQTPGAKGFAEVAGDSALAHAIEHGTGGMVDKFVRKKRFRRHLNFGQRKRYPSRNVRSFLYRKWYVTRRFGIDVKKKYMMWLLLDRSSYQRQNYVDTSPQDPLVQWSLIQEGPYKGIPLGGVNYNERKLKGLRQGHVRDPIGEKKLIGVQKSKDTREGKLRNPTWISRLIWNNSPYWPRGPFEGERPPSYESRWMRDLLHGRWRTGTENIMLSKFQGMQFPTVEDIAFDGSLKAGLTVDRHPSNEPYLSGTLGEYDIYSARAVRESMQFAGQVISSTLSQRRSIMFVVDDDDLAHLIQPFLNRLAEVDKGNQLMWAVGKRYVSLDFLSNWTTIRQKLMWKYPRPYIHTPQEVRATVKRLHNSGLKMNSARKPDLVVYLGRKNLHAVLQFDLANIPVVAIVPSTENTEYAGLVPILGDWNLHRTGRLMSYVEEWVYNGLEGRGMTRSMSFGGNTKADNWSREATDVRARKASVIDEIY